MAIAADLLQSLVPISQFNKGQAAKIFDRLHSERELIVLKNNQPSAIILSPAEYTRLTEIEEDYYLLLEANRRIEENGDNKTVSLDSVMIPAPSAGNGPISGKSKCSLTLTRAVVI